jgi:hypothetical protein
MLACESAQFRFEAVYSDAYSSCQSRSKSSVGTKSGKFIAYISENAINDFVYLKDPNSPFKACSFAAHGCTARAHNLHHPQHASRDWIRNNAGLVGCKGDSCTVL